MTYPPEAPYYNPHPEQEPSPHWPPPAPKKKRHTGLIVAAGLLFGFVTVVILALILSGTPANNNAITFTPAESAAPAGSTPAKKGAPAKAAPTKKVVSVGEGEWLVGDDVQAGTYKTAGAVTGGALTLCSWTVRASDDSGADILDVGLSEKATETGRVKLKNGQVFDTSGCKDWIRQ